jgi:hypothetical protein
MDPVKDTHTANDLTLLYYTASKISDFCGENVRKHLLEVNKNKFPIVSVSQKPLNFGENICVGEIGMSAYNCYKQILTGAMVVKTKYLACCEDDTLYTMEHFSHRPSADDTFAYNINMWFTDDTFFWYKEETAMCMCIAPTELLIKTLKARYDKYPNPIPGEDKYVHKHWQEPGKYDWKFGIPNAKFEHFKTKIGIPVFNYRGSLHGKRGCRRGTRILVNPLPGWGDSVSLWNKYWGTNYDKKYNRHCGDDESR